MILFNKQSRSGWYFVAAILLVMVLLQILEPRNFRYQHDWLQSGEFWRLLTAHWVHVNWIHFSLNAAGLVLCMTITDPVWSIKRWIVYQLILALGISILFKQFNPELGWYVGFSGVLYGIYLLAAVDLFQRDKVIAILVASAIVIKIAIEQSGEINLTTSDIIGTPVIIDAHLYGVLLAMVIALLNWAITIVKTSELSGS